MSVTEMPTIHHEQDREKLVAAGANQIRQSGRSSAFPEMLTSQWVAGLFQQYAGLAYGLPFELLGYIELLATWNPDFSQAVDNIRTLANSGHNLFVTAGSDLATNKAKTMLEDKARTIQMQFGGIDGLIDKLLKQAATYGAMCGEWVLSEDLDDVVDFMDVNPKFIRFFWEADLDRFTPWQLVNATQLEVAKQRGQEIRNNCVKLNEATFHYFAFDAAPASPYGTPPFLAALPNIAIQRDMVANMAQIVKKVGLLGIIDMQVKALPSQPGEQQAQYQARATKFLSDYVTVVQDMVRDGGIVHYDDTEIKTQQLTGNAAGATNIFKQNEELIFSGLKSMPSVQGRSYSTTETYAGVAYDIIIRNTYKYQRAVKRMIEAGYWLMVTLWGLNGVTGISIDFNPNKSLHRLQDAQAFRLEVFNAVLLWALGFYTQQQAAQSIGFQNVATRYETPPESPLLGAPPSVGLAAKDAAGSQESDPKLQKMMDLLEQIQEVMSESSGNSTYNGASNGK